MGHGLHEQPGHPLPLTGASGGLMPGRWSSLPLVVDHFRYFAAAARAEEGCYPARVVRAAAR